MLLMPCPFAPLLALLPSLPFIPWIIAKFFRNKAETLQEMTAASSLSIPIQASEINTFEYYQKKAPNFRKKAAAYSGTTQDGQAEFLVFDSETSQSAAQKLSELLRKLNAPNSKLSQNKLKMNLKKENCACIQSDSDQSELIEHFSKELSKIQV